MSNLILYNLSTSWLLLSSFLILLFVIGCALYLETKVFTLKDGKIKIYGLFLNMRNEDILIISLGIIRTFVVLYSLLIFVENLNLYLSMIAIASIIFVIAYRKNPIYEIINSIALMAIVNFQYQLNTYLTDVQDSSSVHMIQAILVSFTVLYTIYIFLKELDEIVANHKNINE